MTTTENTTPDPLATALAATTAEVREVNTANGWFDDDRRPAEGLALIHSEVSEWLEALRSWGTADATATTAPHHARCPVGKTVRDTVKDAKPFTEGGSCTCSVQGQTRLPKPEGAGSEAADVLIRLLDECDRQGIDLAFEYRRKIAFNRTRGHKHGGRSL
jgi:NTP pyrophosphatase (non-canonical NTP hydrolase)